MLLFSFTYALASPGGVAVADSGGNNGQPGLSLKSVQISTQIADTVAQTMLRQIYFNEDKDDFSAVFLLPVSGNGGARLDGARVSVDGGVSETISTPSASGGRLKTRPLEVPPGGHVVLDARYNQSVERKGDFFTVSLMPVTGAVERASASGDGDVAIPSGSENFMDAKKADSAVEKFRLTLLTDRALTGISSPTHDITVVEAHPGRYELFLPLGKPPTGRPFVLEWKEAQH